MLLMLLMPVVTSNYLTEDFATLGAVGIAIGDVQVNLVLIATPGNVGLSSSPASH